MKKYIYPAFVLNLFFTVLLGILYPGVLDFIGNLFFHNRASGSVILDDTGSEFIGQIWNSEKYFWGRPSASNYDAMNSGGTNYSPIDTRTLGKITEAKKRFQNQSGIPEELLLSSGSGLDPHILFNSAIFQMPRIVGACEGKINEEELRKLIIRNSEGKDFGILGQERVNVLKLNIALDKQCQVKGSGNVDGHK